ncbi:MAG: ABC transporter ATP-binding protein [Hyphomicrobiaceae bacterium]|nr:ABC transporter ATP-binding protein [Hyphomicrobiaceae bacterium]
MPSIISIKSLSKTYSSGLDALKSVTLDIERGEIFALLGPNGAGKTTLINIICGLMNSSSGTVKVNGHDVIDHYRYTRSIIGLVPQELMTDSFETIRSTVNFSRGLFGKKSDPGYLKKILSDLDLWDKRNDQIMTLSGGMKRRLLVAKALSHEPSILFLDEPTAGVDINLRQDMWRIVRDLQSNGVTIILTTHYIKEAEEMADRIGVMNSGELVLVEDKRSLMRKLGKKYLTLQLHNRIDNIPAALAPFRLKKSKSGIELTYTYDTKGEQTGIYDLFSTLKQIGLKFRDLHTSQSSLEDIFVELVGNKQS